MSDEMKVIEGKATMREFEADNYYTQYGDVDFGRNRSNDYLTDELLKYQGKKVRVTIEFID